MTAKEIVAAQAPGTTDTLTRHAHRLARALAVVINLLDPDCIVVDGFVYLDGVERPGLGKYLYDALEGRIGVIGVAKKPFRGIPSRFGIYRGKSKKPLFVTSAGLDVSTAKKFIQAMHGQFRLPTLLREVDRACRGNRG